VTLGEAVGVRSDGCGGARERGRWADTAKNFLTRRGRGGFGLGFTIWDLNTIFYERKWDQIRVSTFKKRQVNLLFELNFFEPPPPKLKVILLYKTRSTSLVEFSNDGQLIMRGMDA